ncbi:hypothetical protein ABVD54_004909 [Vibrio parahaemolyticus]|uniref:hypothetical protein n=1 Tax=Vibrio TaxID=662 RepID=UPI001121DFEE|nr:hypothetical protein [Vibrio parahaemolyticus]EGQ7676528.1 hypothetical protein [Vibrio parahaemolyticus]EHK0753665.1 hypothetical protein [Vibrio parahaemolyticus]EJB8443177.1 hypothetical protein [Vibrio parahaemolyticus]EKQ5899474.1 hypothetical protein [Vibrio parahaemolyticus]ELZ7200916.1 hypothetical protein [Vibrio parahaemolyticus]
MFWFFKSPTPGGLADNFIKNKERFDIDDDGRVTLRMDNDETIKSIQEQIQKLKFIHVKRESQSPQEAQEVDNDSEQ